MPLPPRARGCRGFEHVEFVRPPSTPACAGLPPQSVNRHCRPRLYPRVRGAAVVATSQGGKGEPLPPRARGCRR